MRKALFWSLALLLVCAVGAGIGYYLGYSQGKWHGFVAATERAAAEKPANWEDWKYPNISHHFGTSTGASGHIGGQNFCPQTCFIGTTLDDFDKVVAHYATKCGPDQSRMDFQGGTDSGLQGNMTNCRHLDDSRRPSAGGEYPLRPVKLRTFALQTPNYALTVIVSRAEGEKETHVVLVHQ